MNDNNIHHDLLAQELQRWLLIPDQADGGEGLRGRLLRRDRQRLVARHHRPHALHQGVRRLQHQLLLVLVHVAVDRTGKKSKLLFFSQESIL